MNGSLDGMCYGRRFGVGVGRGWVVGIVDTYLDFAV
jgi:hypothetical protein